MPQPSPQVVFHPLPGSTAASMLATGRELDAEGPKPKDFACASSWLQNFLNAWQVEVTLIGLLVLW